jgi:hypothetical protein
VWGGKISFREDCLTASLSSTVLSFHVTLDFLSVGHVRGDLFSKNVSNRVKCSWCDELGHNERLKVPNVLSSLIDFRVNAAGSWGLRKNSLKIQITNENRMPDHRVMNSAAISFSLPSKLQEFLRKLYSESLLNWINRESSISRSRIPDDVIHVNLKLLSSPASSLARHEYIKMKQLWTSGCRRLSLESRLFADEINFLLSINLSAVRSEHDCVDCVDLMRNLRILWAI